ncbi:MAG TPA: zinc ABC transporter substrate-binding protein, partial [Solirubrobacteraceae bacterium]
QIDALVDRIRRERVRAVFAERAVPATVERAIAREAGATVGGELYADALGPAGSAGDTYVKSIAANTRALVDGFTGGRVRCSLP